MCLIFKCFRRYRDLQSQKENTAVFCFALDFFFKFVFLSKRLKKEAEKVCTEDNEKSWDSPRENKGTNAG